MQELYDHDGTLVFDGMRARAALEQLISCPAYGGVWLIVEAERVAGYVVLTLGYSVEFHGVDAFLDETYVTPDSRNRGIGTAALRFIEDKCLELGVNALHLQVERANTQAQEFYRRGGFVDHDRHLLTKWIKG
jgi:GNAT superfamily N-acetyltransferase